MDTTLHPNEEVVLEYEETDSRTIYLTTERVVAEGKDLIQIHLQDIKRITTQTDSHNNIISIFGGKAADRRVLIISEEETVLSANIQQADWFISEIKRLKEDGS